MPTDEGRRYEDKQKDCDRRFEAVEKDLCVINKPESGALATMKKEINEKISELHEKINKGLSHRPRWTVFWAVISILIIIVFSSYSYTYNATDKLDSKYESLVTKEDFKEFKKEILERFSQFENKIEKRK